MKSKRYQITLTGVSPLIMHKDNLSFGEKIQKWQRDPANKSLSVKGDDRSPAWTWIGYLYHQHGVVGIDADNFMTMLREGGAKVIMKGSKTYQSSTQSGVLTETLDFPITVGGKTIPSAPIEKLIGETNFEKHEALAESLGFGLLVKRARISTSKHVRVRPIFHEWQAMGTITVLNEDIFGITKEILEVILTQSGMLCGLCDWRPSSKKPGGFGKFTADVKLL